jgi:hypothetical protein
VSDSGPESCSNCEASVRFCLVGVRAADVTVRRYAVPLSNL